MPQEVPPSRPVISSAHRAEFRARLQALMAQRQLSGRQVEDRLNLGGGTLSKIYSGKMQLTHRLLAALSKLLEVPPEQIVSGTAFSYLLETPVPTQEADDLATAKKEIDYLRVELKARDATVNSIRENLTAARSTEEDQRRQVAKLQLDVASLKGKIDSQERDLARASDERRTAHHDAQNLRAALSAETGRTVALSEAMEKWRVYGLQQHQRAEQLSAYVVNLRAELENESRTKAQAVLGTGLLGFTIGAYLNSKD